MLAEDAVRVAKNVARMMVWNIMLAHIMRGAFDIVTKSMHGYKLLLASML